MARWRCVPGLACALLVGGCSNDEPRDDGAAGALSGDVSCTADPRVEPFYEGMAKDGERGVLRFELLASDPAPPAKGDNTFELRISDHSGDVAEVALAVELSMPDHGHGSRALPKVSFDGQAFTVTPLDLFMAGVWQIELRAVDAADDATALDAARFFFCIEG